MSERTDAIAIVEASRRQVVGLVDQVSLDHQERCSAALDWLRSLPEHCTCPPATCSCGFGGEHLDNNPRCQANWQTTAMAGLALLDGAEAAS